MIGPKKLSMIRQELHRALAATGDDPLRWLEARMTAPASGESEVLQSLRRVVEATRREKPGKRRIGAKK